MSTLPPITMPGLTPEATTAAAPVTKPVRVAKPADKRGWWWGTGRRKTAVARIRLRPATDGKAGMILTSTSKTKKTIEQYFAEERDRSDAVMALKIANIPTDKLEIVGTVQGGGFMGQAGAVRLAVARALIDYDPTTEAALRSAGLLTRDARKVERKKYGQAGARRRFQFSKR